MPRNEWPLRLEFAIGRQLNTVPVVDQAAVQNLWRDMSSEMWNEFVDDAIDSLLMDDVAPTASNVAQVIIEELTVMAGVR